jgi:uncharacterized membrane protein
MAIADRGYGWVDHRAQRSSRVSDLGRIGDPSLSSPRIGPHRTARGEGGATVIVSSRRDDLASTGRVEAFSDAVFAITITLLVLEIERPPFDSPDLGRLLVEGWPQYVAFVVSFIYVGALWLNHHALLERMARVDLAFQWINLAILGTTALIPFSTGVLAGAFGVDAPTENRKAAVALYALVAFLMSAAWLPVFGHLRRHPELLQDPTDQQVMARQRPRPIVGMISYAIAGVLGYLVSPLVALVIFVWMIVYHVATSEGLDANRFGRLLSPGGPHDG